MENRAAIYILCLAALAGCDRGWAYRVPNATPLTFADRRQAYEVISPDHTRLQIDASLWLGTVRVRLEVSNVGDEPLVIDAQSLAIFRGTEQLQPGAPAPIRCDEPDQGKLVLEPGHSCRIRAGFHAPQSEAKLRDLRLLYRGAMRGKQEVVIDALLKKID